MTQAQSTAQAPAGPRVEDQQDGKARVQIDQVVPWLVAMQLLDILADDPPRSRDASQKGSVLQSLCGGE